jgi:hypothetical protein
LNQNRALVYCFDAFSSREPASTSLENATVLQRRRLGRLLPRRRRPAIGHAKPVPEVDRPDRRAQIAEYRLPDLSAGSAT